ncbi:RNA-binding domain-containing protein [Corynebacterium glyciniphilum]|uniref:RNA-binding domain-containing protein n=1 Tax=Corynebacterium glyciniphilum TaxID=1404244 RepID=UPI0011AB4686|nr:RNA-binding domain-containing protein [Corynebacterium glyciniphilum]
MEPAGDAPGRQRALPRDVAEALDRILDGAVADDLESSVLDFKEDPAHTPTRRPDEKAADMLVKTACCFANGSAGRGFIVFGIADRTPGPDAFNGTDRDPAEIAHLIFTGTRPHLTVDAWDAYAHGARIIVIRVPAGLAVHTGPDEIVRHRVGDACLPLEGEPKELLARARGNPDYTAEPSSVPLQDYDVEALAAGRELLATAQRAGTLPNGDGSTGTGLLAKLDLLTDGGAPTVAAELLFHRAPGARHLYRAGDTESAHPPTETLLDLPLVLSATSLRDLVRAHDDSSIPAAAADEAITNALVHRDWSRPEPVVVFQSPQMIRVHSPGGLPGGNTADRLLSGPSQPRNPALLNAMQLLGLERWSSRGFDRMWLAMLSAGFEPPVVDAKEDAVDVTLFNGEPDMEFVSLLSAVRAEYGRGVARDAATLVVLRHLMAAGTVDLELAALLQQAGEADARSLMTWLAQRGVVQRTARRRDEWRFSDRVAALVPGSAAE